MKRFVTCLLVIALIAGESSCVVRVKERRRPVPPPPPRHGVVVY